MKIVLWEQHLITHPNLTMASHAILTFIGCGGRWFSLEMIEGMEGAKMHLNKPYNRLDILLLTFLTFTRLSGFLRTD